MLSLYKTWLKYYFQKATQTHLVFGGFDFCTDSSHDEQDDKFESKIIKKIGFFTVTAGSVLELQNNQKSPTTDAKCYY